MHGHMLGHTPAVALMVDTAVRLEEGQPFTVPCRRGDQAGDENPLLAIAKQRSVAIPVAEHHRQTRRHGLHRRLAEGFQDGVGKGEEQICRCPALPQQWLIISIQPVHRHRGGMGPGRLFEPGLVPLRRRVPARHQEVDRCRGGLGRQL